MKQVDVNFYNPKTRVLYLEKSDGKRLRLHEMIVDETFIHITAENTTTEYLLREGLRSNLGWIDRAPGEAVFKTIEEVAKSPYTHQLMKGTDGKIELLLDYSNITETKLKEAVKLSEENGQD